MATNSQLSTRIKIDYDVELQNNYKLVIHNDDTTSFELVVYVLVEFCDKSYAEAIATAAYVHENGKKDIMEGSQEYLAAKRDKCIRFARENGYNDFRMSVEEM